MRNHCIALDADAITGGGDAVPVALAAAEHDDGSIDVHVGNRAVDGTTSASLDLRAFPEIDVVEALVLTHDDPFAVNSAEHPETVVPRPLPVEIENGDLRALLPASIGGEAPSPVAAATAAAIRRRSARSRARATTRGR